MQAADRYNQPAYDASTSAPANTEGRWTRFIHEENSSSLLPHAMTASEPLPACILTLHSLCVWVLCSSGRPGYRTPDSGLVRLRPLGRFQPGRVKHGCAGRNFAVCCSPSLPLPVHCPKEHGNFHSSSHPATTPARPPAHQRLGTRITNVSPTL